MNVQGIAILASLFAAAVVTAASLLQQPTYEASAEMRVVQKQGEQQTNVTGSGEEIKTLPPGGEGIQQFIPTLIHVIDSRPVAEDATKQLSFEMSPEQLLANLTTRHIEGTNFIHLTYEGTNLPEAVQIVNTVGVVSSERITETSGSNLTARVHEKARVPDNPTPVSPDPLRNGILAAVFGLMLGIGLALLMEYLDHSWRSPEEVEQASGVPTFATIPEFSVAKSKGKRGR